MGSRPGRDRAWTCRIEVDWSELSSSVRTLIVAQVLLVRPRRPQVPEELFELHGSLLSDFARHMSGTMSVEVQLAQDPGRIVQLQAMEEEKASMLRAGASTELMQYLFRISKRQVQGLRRRIGMPDRQGGRPRKPPRDIAYEIAARWSELEDRGLSPLARMRELHVAYPDYSLATLFALVRELS